MQFSMTDFVALFSAIALAAFGGEFFLRGVIGCAAWLRLPKLLVATSLSAFATSSPELTVSTVAAFAGKPELGLGDALGSNVVNIALILGLALLYGPLPARLLELRRDFIFALMVPILTLFLVADGLLSRSDGLFLLLLFALWFSLIARQAIKHRRTSSPEEMSLALNPIHASLFMLMGLSCLILAGHLFVSGASGIATALGINDYVIGATIVAIGTSLPELVTSLLARWRGHDDVGLGTLLGSNLFNGLAIVGLAATIHPIQASLSEVSVALVFGVMAILLIVPHKNAISPQRGLGLLAAYAGYVALTLTR